MKKTAFITTRRMLGQSLVDAAKARPELGLDIYLMIDIKKALLDASVLKTDVAVVDVADRTAEAFDAALALCGTLRAEVPDCRLVLMLSQEDAAGQKRAIEAKRNAEVDDFIFHDATLDYLLAKLVAI